MIPREKSAAKKTVSTAMPVEALAANKTARKIRFISNYNNRSYRKPKATTR